jgi:lipopolysaccharide assembly outer membrane protein LptD (OstA)
LFSQEGIPVIDTNTVSRDTIPFDTISPGLKLISPHAIDKQVIYSSRGAKKNDLINKTATMIDGANVKYGDIEITADSIVFNMAKNTVFAAGRRDTTGKIIGTPVFKEGNTQEIESDSLIYNFVTRKAIVYNIVTKQDEGLLRSKVTKLLDDGTSNIARSTYSTCDAEVRIST